MELFIGPGDVQFSSNQFGFKSDNSVVNGVKLLNYLASYWKHNQYIMYLCSLDAEAYIYLILFYKLMYVLTDVEWPFPFKWYTTLHVVIKWNEVIIYKSGFKVTRGTRQGNILSPILFNILLSDLMLLVSSVDFGFKIGNEINNSFAYADDIWVFSSTVPWLRLINICHDYATTWRIKFGTIKIQGVLTCHNSRYVVDTSYVSYLRGIACTQLIGWKSWVLYLQIPLITTYILRQNPKMCRVSLHGALLQALDIAHVEESANVATNFTHRRLCSKKCYICYYCHLFEWLFCL